MLRGAYILAAINLKRERGREPSKMTKEIPKLKVGDLVSLRDLKEQILGCKVYA